MCCVFRHAHVNVACPCFMPTLHFIVACPCRTSKKLKPSSPCCMFMLLIHATGSMLHVCTSLLHVSDAWFLVAKVHVACLYLMYKLYFHTVCSCYIFIQHVHVCAACPSCMSMLNVHPPCLMSLWCMSLLQVRATYSCCMSMLHDRCSCPSYSTCPSCIHDCLSMLLFRAAHLCGMSIQLIHAVWPCRMSVPHGHVRAACPCSKSIMYVHAAWHVLAACLWKETWM
jgi:hypothetical protein